MNTKHEPLEPKTQPPQVGYHIDDSTSNVHPRPQIDDPNYKPGGKLKGKTALITGGDSGIGAAAAIAYAKEGARVAITYLDSEEDAQDVVQAIRRHGSEGFCLAGDVGDEGFAAAAVRQVLETFGRLDILVNNAAEQHPQDSILDISQEQLDRTFRTNLFSMFYMVKSALPHMPRGGCVINTSSVTAYRGSEHLLDYAATKGAIVSFTRSLATNQDFLARGLRANVVAPGPVWTPLIPASFGPAHSETFGKDVLLGRPAHPYEMAAAYVFLACDDSSYMTGQTLHLNGGEIVGG